MKFQRPDVCWNFVIILMSLLDDRGDISLNTFCTLLRGHRFNNFNFFPYQYVKKSETVSYFYQQPYYTIIIRCILL